MTTSRISGRVPLLLMTLICVGMVEGGYLLLEHIFLDISEAEPPNAFKVKSK